MPVPFASGSNSSSGQVHVHVFDLFVMQQLILKAQSPPMFTVIIVKGHCSTKYILCVVVSLNYMYLIAG